MEKTYTITDITPQIKTKDRLNIFLDGEYHCSLFSETVVLNRLKIGQTVTEWELNEIKAESGQKLCFNKAVGYISRRRATEKGIREYLQKKEFPDNAIEFAVEKLKYYNFIDDKQYAKDFYDYNSNAKGWKKIEYELKNKGITHIPQPDSGDIYEKEAEACGALAEKYMKSKEYTEKTKQKLYNYLLYRGFRYEIIADTLKRQFGDREY